jgi:uncharacterized protein
MKRILVYCALLVLALTGCSRSRAAGPVKLDKTATGTIIKEIEKDRGETREWLQSNPRSYLAAVDRIDFGAKSTLTVGKADDNDVRLSAADIEPHHLRITVDGDRFRVEAIDGKAGFKAKDVVQREAMLDPSYIQVGRFHLRLSHQRYPAIIVFDPRSPRMKEYKGIEYFPVDLSYRYELPLTRIPKPEKMVIVSTRGNRRSAERVGWLDFLVGKTPSRLEVNRLLEPGSGEDDLSVLFTDATSGKETYQLGRYVDLKKLPNGKYLLDFNTAYNPSCAFSNFYNCPVPPKANALTVAIRAGEKDSHYH